MIDRATDIVTLQPIYHMLNEAILTLLGGVVIWATTYAKNWLETHARFLDQQTDKTLADGLNRALQNGVQIAMQKTEDLERQYPGVPVKNAIGAWAANYAVQHSPDAIQRFTGLTLNDLAEKALAYLPTPAVTDGLTGQTIPAPIPVQVKTLP